MIKNTLRVVGPIGFGKDLVPLCSPSSIIRAKSAMRMASRSTSTLSFMTTRKGWLPPPVPEALRRLGVLQEVIKGSLNLGLLRLLEEASRPLRYWVPARKLWDWKREMSERGLLGSPALLEMLRGPDGKRVPLTRALMGLPNPPRDWVLLLRREYLDARKVEAEMLQKAGRGRALRALVSAVIRGLPVGVVVGALGLAVVAVAAATVEHPLLVRVARAG